MSVCRKGFVSGLFLQYRLWRFPARPCAKALVEALRKRLGVSRSWNFWASQPRVVESTYDTVRALGTLAVDTTSAAAGIVCARVHWGGRCGNFVEMQKAWGAGGQRSRDDRRKRDDVVES